jgi:large subunit ribosomal protein L15
MRLNTLSPRPGSKHRVKRLGCGESSGHGKTCCKGNKGQYARSGGSIRPGFEGGQMPIYRRLPKKGFNNINFKYQWAVVNVATLNDTFNDGDEINEDTLREYGIVQGRRWDGVKVLGDGELTKKLSITAEKFTASAREKIEKAGGKAIEAKPAAK